MQSPANGWRNICSNAKNMIIRATTQYQMKIGHYPPLTGDVTATASHGRRRDQENTLRIDKNQM